MSSAPPLDITVVYSRSARGRRGGRQARSGSGLRRQTLLGLVNLLVAGVLYAGTWWWADPTLQVKVLMHTEFGGVTSDELADRVIPDRAGSAPGENPAELRVKGLTARGKVFVATVYGWELLSTFSFCALALSAGAMLRRGGGSAVRIAVALSAAALCGLLVWQVVELTGRFGGYVPAESRYAAAALICAAACVGVLVVENVRRWTRVAAVLVILAAAGTVWGLHVGVSAGAVEARYTDLPWLMGAFAVHSAWGWALIPLAARLPR